MKKLLFISMLFIIVSPVIGQDFDLTAMSFDELSALKQQVDLEWRSRPENEIIKLDVGKYKVGVDIPAGQYYPYSDSSETIFEVKDINDKTVYYDRCYFYTKPERIYELKEAYGIEVKEGIGILSPYNIDPSELMKKVHDFEELEGTRIPNGRYVIGEEIPSGYYILASPQCSSYVKVKIQQSPDPYDYINIQLNCASKFDIKLSEGEQLSIEGPGLIMKKENITFNFD